MADKIPIAEIAGETDTKHALIIAKAWIITTLLSQSDVLALPKKDAFVRVDNANALAEQIIKVAAQSEEAF